jgi:hypothetical protein
VATYNKFQAFVEHVNEGVHNLASNTLKVMLTNSAPLATNSVKADLTDIAAGFGYTAGGATVTISSSAQSSGTYKIVGTDLTITAVGGSIGPFRYAVLYNDTPTSPADPLIGWWDNGSSITLNAGESVTINFDDANGIFQMT